MSKFLNYSKQFFEHFDLFPSTQFLRYKQRGNFKTATGGCVSVAVIIIFIILFYSLGMQTFNQEIIYGSVSYTNQVQPEPITVTFTKGSNFMFALGIQYLDLGNTSKKYFNISLKQHHFGPLLSGNNYTNVPLIPCTADHFSYNKDILDFYYKFYLNTALCPPLNYDFTVGGRIVSDLYSQFSVYIEYCNKTIDSSCATDAQVLALQNQFGGFIMYAPIISTVVNPGDSIYKQVYVQQRNYYFFTTTSGLWINGQIQQYQIDTDVTLLPSSDIKSQFITTIPNTFQMKPKPVYNGRYVEIIFSKSGISTIFSRSFNKLDNYFSYVGGLVGTMLLFFFVFSSYSQTSFILSIASQLYKFQEKDHYSPWKRYNFFYFVSTTLKGILGCLRIQPQWQQSNKFMRIMKQMQKQLSISLLIKRINYLDQAISTILTEHQVDTLYLNHKISISKAAAKRIKTDIPQSALEFEGKHTKSNRKVTNINQQQNDRSKDNFMSFHNIDKIPSNLQINSEQNQTQNWPSSQKQQRQEIVNNIRQSLVQVFTQSKQGNAISRRIIDRVKRIFPQSQFGKNQQAKVQNEFTINKTFEEKRYQEKLEVMQLQERN